MSFFGLTVSKAASASFEALANPLKIGGPSRTRTLDPLIKRHRTAVREIKHFSYRRYVSHGLLSLSKGACVAQGKRSRANLDYFQPTNQPTTLGHGRSLKAINPQRCCFGSESAEGTPEGRNSARTMRLGFRIVPDDRVLR